MKNNLYIAPSILNADFNNIERDLSLLENLGVKYLHFDVMDGKFVPNTSFNEEVLIDIKKISNLFMDVHLMIENPHLEYLKYINAGASMITFHYESYSNDEDVLKLIHKIKEKNIKVGISIKPNTDYNVLIPFLDMIDNILIMSVEPGFGGQKFIENSLNKISSLKKEIDKRGLKATIEVDGGINDSNLKKVYEAGASIVVVGSYLFKAKDISEAYNNLWIGF